MMKGSFKRKTFLVLFFTMMASLFFASLSVQAASKKVKQPKKIIYVGQTTKLTIKKVSANKATWKSSNKKVATVTKNGKVKATKKGNVTISATYKNTIYQWKITVKKAQLQKSKVTLEEGKTFQLKLLGSQIRSCAVQNKKIATVTKKGKITAKKTGTTKITVVGKNKKTYTCKLTVSKPTPAGNDIIDPENGTVPEVTTSPEDTTDVEDTTTSENPTVPGDSTTSGDPTVSDDSNTSENPTVPDDSNTSDNPTVPGDNTTSGDPTVPDDSTTSGDPTVSDDSNTSDNPTAPDDNAADDSPGGTKGDSSTKADSLLTSIQDAIVTPENLGVPAVLTSKYGNNYYAKSIWDMKTWNGKVFIGTGDYTSNTGPTPIYYFTNDSTEAQKTTATTLSGSTSTSGLSTEAVERFFEIDGNLYTVAADPKGSPACGSYYKYDEIKNTWMDYAVLPDAVHMYDMVEYDGKIFFGGMVYATGTTDLIGSCIQVIDKNDLNTSVKATTLPFYKADGTTQFQAKGDPYAYYWRVYDLLIYKNELYAIHQLGDPTTAVGLFKYNKDLNGFVQVYDGYAQKGVIAVANNHMTTGWQKVNGEWVESPCYYRFEDNERIFEELKVGMETLYGRPQIYNKIIVGDTAVFVKNGIFKSSDLMTFEKVSLGTGCENYVVRDAFEIDGKSYFLASEMLGTNQYMTTVFETDTNFTTYRKVLSFETQSYAQNFAYNDGYLYFGLGHGKSSTTSGYSEYCGTILRVNLKEVQ